MKKKKISNKKVLESINSPNVWSPKIEDLWIKELRGMTRKEIYEKFPPYKRPPHVSRVTN